MSVTRFDWRPMVLAPGFICLLIGLSPGSFVTTKTAKRLFVVAGVVFLAGAFAWALL